jgi:4-amino-4-deoxy-L-arabinose transferase-like glycosyltransferase
VIVDRTWLHFDHTIPAWDQADYLNGAMEYWQALQTPRWSSHDWWVSLWSMSSKIPPLVYLLTASMLQGIGPGIDQSLWIQPIFTAILLVSVYGLASCLFSPRIGLWAAGLAVLLPGLFPLRLQFLLDYPVTAMVALSFWLLTLWQQGPGSGQASQPSATSSLASSSFSAAFPGRAGDRHLKVSTTAPPTSATTELRLLQQMITTLPLAPATAPEPDHSEIPATAELASPANESAAAESAAAESAANGRVPETIAPPSPARRARPWPKFSLPPAIYPWLRALAWGLALGLSLLTKQTVLLFLLLPIAAAGIQALWHRQWHRLGQWVLGLIMGILVAYPWYRTNWLLILTSGQRATVQSAIAEGDPPLTSLAAWTYYLPVLAQQISYPLLLVGLVGLVLYWKRVGEPTSRSRARGIEPKQYRQRVYRRWGRSLRWLLLFLGGAYLLSSLNINKDLRYMIPCLPVIAVLMAQGLCLLPRSLVLLRWGVVGFTLMTMLASLFPILPWQPLPLLAQPAQNWQQEVVVKTVIQAEPYLQQVVGVGPSLPELNQYNVNYVGNLHHFQVYGRQVGAQRGQVWEDSRALSWYLFKTQSSGSIRQPDALQSLTQRIVRSREFDLQQTWSLPDGSELQLYHRRNPPVVVTPVVGVQWGEEAPVRLEQVIVPQEVPAGQPLPVTYKWAGRWPDLRSGLVILTWKRSPAPDERIESPATPTKTGTAAAAPRWLHDHALGLGQLVSATADSTNVYQVTENLAMLPPSTAQGSYNLEAIYLNRQTGETYPIATPNVSLTLSPSAKPLPAPELDPLTQVRLMASRLPQGMPALEGIFRQVGVLNLFHPNQDYLSHAQQALTYRLQAEPQNTSLYYALALTHVLRRNVEEAIATLQQVTRLDAKNPNAYAYLAFVNLYDFRPQAAQAALQSALALNPKLPELHVLQAAAQAMQGRLLRAWQEYRTFQAHSAHVS